MRKVLAKSISFVTGKHDDRCDVGGVNILRSDVVVDGPAPAKAGGSAIRGRRSDHFMKRREINASSPQVEATTGGQSLGHAIRIRRRNPA